MNNRKMMLSIAAVVAVAAVMWGIYALTRPDPSAGEKNITVSVIHKDETEKIFTYATDKEYLGEYLLSKGLSVGEEGPYGLYITQVDGESAIYEEDKSYWAFYENGSYASVGIDQTIIEDGDQFSLVYTIG